MGKARRLLRAIQSVVQEIRSRGHNPLRILVSREHEDFLNLAALEDVGDTLLSSIVLNGARGTFVSLFGVTTHWGAEETTVEEYDPETREHKLIFIGGNRADGVKQALDIAARYGQDEGAHHEMWCIDQMVRALTGDGYEEWVREYQSKGRTWETGIA